MKVLKFGGSSLATAESFLNAANIAKREERGVFVVSAPGKSTLHNEKITDLLQECYDLRLKFGKCDQPFAQFRNRFLDLAHGLNISQLDPHLDQIFHDINSGARLDYILSRGEYLSALLMRRLLDCDFVDAADLIKFDSLGNFDFSLSRLCIKNRLSGCKKVVISGFYGALPNGEIKTFSRGGSDITGAIICAAIGGKIYENWTDVDGIFFCPLTEKCKPLREISYRQMREIAYMGSRVLHPDSVIYLADRGIKTVIKNTFNPDAEGTKICDIVENNGGEVVAFSGKCGFNMLGFYKLGDQPLADIVADILQQGAKIFSIIGGVDSLTILLDGEIKSSFCPQINQKIALFTVLANNKKSVTDKINANIDYELMTIDTSSGGIILAAKESDFEKTMQKLNEIFS